MKKWFEKTFSSDIFNIFIACVDHDIAKCLLMVRQAETTWKSKLHENQNMIWKKQLKINL